MQKYQTQLQTAATKDEALTLAIGVAENLMKALKLSSSPEEKKDLKSQCGVIMDVADRIKNSKEWAPLAPPKQERTKNEEIGRWAADVAQSAASAAPYQGASPQPAAALLVDISSTPAVAQNTRAASGNSLTPTSTTIVGSQNAHDSVDLKGARKGDIFGSLIDLSNRRFNPLDANATSPYVDATPYTNPQPIVKNESDVEKAPIVAPKAGQGLISPPADVQCHDLHIQNSTGSAVPPASHSHVRRLKEPISTRKLTKKEEIILLKASVVNGFKCPPWDKNPASAEFALEDGADLFSCVCTVAFNFCH